MTRGIALQALLIAALLSPCAAARADEAVVAKVIAVIDGDTLLLMPLDSGQIQPRFYKLRLANIDAPERGQPFAEEAKRALANLVLHQQVSVLTVATDSYGRYIGWVTLDRGLGAEMAVNAELVQRGWAWALSRGRQPHLRMAQQEARRAGRGLWAEPNAVPPWVWRKKKALRGSSELNPAFANTRLPAPLRD